MLTAITGKPLVDEAPTRYTPWTYFRVGFLATACGIAGGWLAWQCRPWGLPFLPWCWMVEVYGARILRNVCLHMCAHTAFTRRRRLDRWLGRLIALLYVTEEFDGYKRAHIGHHHSAAHQTVTDPTVVFLLQEIGLRPGMAKSEMWRRLAWTAVSPGYHWRFTRARIASHFQGTTWGYRCLFAAWITLLVALAIWFVDPWAMLVTVVVPLFPIYQICSALRLASKHVFASKLPAVRDRDTLGMFTLGIFVGDACPPAGLAGWKWLSSWTRWWLRWGFCHVPTRAFVIVGDAPAHDAHHRHPCDANWPNYIHARHADLVGGENGEVAPYREVWGLHAAIDACFASLAAASPDDYPAPERATFTFLTADD